jgi:hypothetical protein
MLTMRAQQQFFMKERAKAHNESHRDHGTRHTTDEGCLIGKLHDLYRRCLCADSRTDPLHIPARHLKIN